MPLHFTPSLPPPASKAGDRIESFDGTKVKTFTDLSAAHSACLERGDQMVEVVVQVQDPNNYEELLLSDSGDSSDNDDFSPASLDKYPSGYVPPHSDDLDKEKQTPAEFTRSFDRMAKRTRHFREWAKFTLKDSGPK